eukprot:6210769-Pleurochrysis_carterae.AAC.2
MRPTCARSRTWALSSCQDPPIKDGVVEDLDGLLLKRKASARQKASEGCWDRGMGAATGRKLKCTGTEHGI